MPPQAPPTRRQRPRAAGCIASPLGSAHWPKSRHAAHARGRARRRTFQYASSSSTTASFSLVLLVPCEQRHSVVRRAIATSLRAATSCAALNRAAGWAHLEYTVDVGLRLFLQHATQLSKDASAISTGLGCEGGPAGSLHAHGAASLTQRGRGKLLQATRKRCCSGRRYTLRKHHIHSCWCRQYAGTGCRKSREAHGSWSGELVSELTWRGLGARLYAVVVFRALHSGGVATSCTLHYARQGRPLRVSAPTDAPAVQSLRGV